MHSLYDCDFEYDDHNDSDSHAAKVEYNYLFNLDTETYEAYANYDFDDDFDDNELEDDYNDYDDIRLVPPSPRKAKPKRNKTFKPKTPKKYPVETKVIQPLLESPQPPELPLEILEFVCAHLSQTTLRYGVNRVCRKWHEVSSRFVRRAGIWKPVNGAQELLLQQWSKINTLELWFCQDPEFPTVYFSSNSSLDFWNAFAATITASTSTERDAQQDDTSNYSDKKSDSSVPSSLLQTIRHLEMRGQRMSYIDMAPKLRDHLQFIESLTITTVHYYANIPLFTVLADFPSLRNFTVSLQTNIYAHLKHGDDDDHIVDQPEPAVDPETAHFPRKPWVIPPPKMFSDRYRLQRFSVTGVGTHLRVLERLLVTCPDLRVFKANNTTVNMYIRQHGEDAEHNARQRLIDLAAKYCPRLEWYNFHRLEYSATDEAHLGYIARTFSDHKFLSMTLCGYQETMPNNPAARDLLSRITVLDIQPSPYVNLESKTLNRILCLTPNLLHLHGIKALAWTSDLWQPPAPVLPAPKPFFNNVRDRKRYERNERRETRQQALARYQPSPVATTTGENGTDGSNSLTVDPSIPVTWQLYNLKTLELSLSGGSIVVAFTDYISRHRLFRNLVTFNLLIPSLKIGQRVNFADPKKPAAITAASPSVTTPASATFNTSGSGGKQHSSVAAPPPEPERYSNELLALHSLRCLEECILRATDVPGMVLAKDFEFLRRKEDFQTMSFIPKRRKLTTKSSTMSDPVSTEQSLPVARKNKRSISVTGDNEKDGLNEGDEDDDEDDDDEGEEQQERLKTETFWPKLNTFHVYYVTISPFISTSKLTYGIEEVRPGVAVRFQHRAILS
ncbi:hypothetical protein BG015_005222 [Linnemannia schmuckeri]|uniref:F-box domain-containing protein n=1 Tax=Linnemannia schmuckeri TaxID=64567 RepID=A0A9P5S4M4_9FUNG|nr:hypothetical protein BG015_005222 [Linnemannia schmuckeri]